jgi:hypothetical protein
VKLTENSRPPREFTLVLNEYDLDQIKLALDYAYEYIQEHAELRGNTRFMALWEELS